MNNLKKTVAIVIAVAMVLSMGVATSFAAFSDVPSTVSYAEAVNVLANLNIIEGYEDGTFRPDETITRAEVATMVVKTLGLGATNGATPFTDVPADHWAAGYINSAYNNGIISGMGDGTFAPGANVTFEQVVRMIVSAINYDIPANNAGGYPTGYLAVASQQQITGGGVNGVVGQPATRAQVAKIIYNALEVPMLQPSVYGYGVTDTRYTPDERKTLLTNMGVEKLEVIVTNTYLTDGTYNRNNKSIDVVAAKSYQREDYPYSKYITEDIERGGSFEISTFNEGGTAAASLLGYACIAYVGEDSETGDETIFAISAKGTRNNVTTVKGDLFATDDDKDKDKLYYYKNSKSDTKASSLVPSTDREGDIDVKVFMNYSTDGAPGDGELTLNAINSNNRDQSLTQIFWDYFNEDGQMGGTVRFIDNDNDNEFEYVIASKYTNEAVIESVEEDNGEWIFNVYSGEMDEYDEDDDDVLKLFIKGENYINVSEIAEGDTITTVACDNDVTLYYVSSTVVEGTTTRYNTEDQTVTINGTTYGVSPASNITLNDVRNKEGAFYINVDGLIAYYDATASVGGDFAYVTWAGENTNYNATNYQLQLVNSQGQTGVYNLAKTTYVYGAEGRTKHTAEEAMDIVAELIANGNIGDRMIRYTASNNQISKIVTTAYSDFNRTSISNTKAYDAEEHSIGGVSFSDSTLVFALDIPENAESADYGDPDNVSVGTVARYFADDNVYEGSFYMDNTGDDVFCILAVNPKAAIDQENNVFVVSGVSVDMIDDEPAIVVEGYTGGKSETFTIYDADDASVAEKYYDDATGGATFTKGTVLMKGEAVGGYVTEIEILATLPSANGYATGDAPVLGEDARVDFTDNKKHVIQDIVNVDVEATKDRKIGSDRVVVDKYCDEFGYRPHGNTVISLVDCTSLRLTRVTVASNRAASAVHIANSKYAASIFFRAYDTDVDSDAFDLQEGRSTVKDLVIYRFNADQANGQASYESSNDYDYDDDDENLIPDEDGEVIDGDDNGEIIGGTDDDENIVDGGEVEDLIPTV